MIYEQCRFPETVCLSNINNNNNNNNNLIDCNQLAVTHLGFTTDFHSLEKSLPKINISIFQYLLSQCAPIDL